MQIKTVMSETCPSCLVFTVSTLEKLLQTLPVQIPNMDTLMFRTRTCPPFTWRSNQPLLTVMWLVQVLVSQSCTSSGHQLLPVC